MKCIEFEQNFSEVFLKPAKSVVHLYVFKYLLFLIKLIFVRD